ncbi:hypothetical protein D0Z08_30175 [Nocardioides immobilis]|uniref:LysM domain-containing protein n=1 Tax=Nocardioides immobilis TaxID=2049295 RepID=A0A417XSD4_9ACTN|nr:hypothetical protein [Nocardioides immobilis]RHW23359.1 hypothetical protein D0Z08_30175 [Nocardioides immobilis]
MNLLTSQLTKLTLEAYEDVQQTKPVGLVWATQLNPTELTFSRKNTYPETKAAGADKPESAYTGGEPDEASLELLLDGTGVVDEPGSIKGRLDGLLKFASYHGEEHQPYYVHAHWGPFTFRGVITSADVTYKLFDRGGEPLRATVKLSLKEVLSREEIAAIEKRSSPDLFQTWLVRDGERLDAIAAQVYGDAAYWRPLARANRLANPRGLVTGQVLVLPPVAAR